MSKIIIALVIATICQLGTMGEEEKVSIKRETILKLYTGNDHLRHWLLIHKNIVL
jgi:hypothetical protein